MYSNHFAHTRCLGVFSLLLITIAGCGGGEGRDGDVASIEYIRGRIDCGAQSDASSTVASCTAILAYDVDGASLSIPPPDVAASGDSCPSGSFVVPVRDLPDAFTLVAEDVSCSNGMAATATIAGPDAKAAQATSALPFYVGQMKAEVLHYDPAQDIVHVSPVTTLIAVYRERHPDTDYQTAQTKVKHFLGIPESVDLSVAPDLSEMHFSVAQFITEAEVAGSAELLLETLLAEMQADPSATHPFYSYAVSASVALGVGGAIDFVADNLAKGALSEIGGQSMGWLLSSIGVNFDPAAKAIKEMQADLATIKNSLAELAGQMTQLNRDLKKEISNKGYATLRGQLDELETLIESEWRALEILAAHGGEPERATWAAEEVRRLKVVLGTQICNRFGEIHKKQAPALGEGMIEVWSQVVADRHRFLGPDDSRMMRAQFDYYDALQLAQFGLCIEYHHLVGAPAATLEQLVDQYFKNRQAQDFRMPTPIPDKALVETATGLMISPYTIWGDAPGLHFGYHFACNLPIHNRAPHATLSDYFNSTNSVPGSFIGEPPVCTTPTEGKFSVPLLGFKTWRVATRSEAKDMFAGWSSNSKKSIAQWAVSQGYPEDCIFQGRQRACIDETVEMFLTSVPKYYRRPSHPNWDEALLGRNLKVYRQSMSKGDPKEIECAINTSHYPRSTSVSWQCATFQGIHGKNGFWSAPKGHLIPVRTPGWSCDPCLDCDPPAPLKECYYYRR